MHMIVASAIKFFCFDESRHIKARGMFRPSVTNVKGGFYLVGPKTCCFFWNFFLGKYDRYVNEILASCRVQFIEATQFFWG